MELIHQLTNICITEGVEQVMLSKVQMIESFTFFILLLYIFYCFRESYLNQNFIKYHVGVTLFKLHLTQL